MLSIDASRLKKPVFDEALAARSGAIPFFKPRPWNQHLVVNSPEFARFVADTAAQIEKAEKRKERPKEAREAFLAAISALILDLHSAYTVDPHQQVGINLDANRYAAKKRTRYSNQRLTSKQLKAAFDGLQRLGYLTIDKRGWHDASGKGANTKIRATEGLIELLTGNRLLADGQAYRSPDAEVIWLRGMKTTRCGKGPLIDYEDDLAKHEMRNRLRHINAVINEHVLRLAMSEKEFLRLQVRLSNSKDPYQRPVEFTRRSLRRIFNGRFDRGGRFYHGWWQDVSEEYRSLITIDGEPTVEADFSAIHARLLYAREGLDYAGDPYDVGLDPRHREWVKWAFNSPINAKSKQIALPEGYDPDDVGMTHKALLDHVRQHHEPVSKYFCTGVGLELQYIDSCIAERVIWHFADRGLVDRF